MNQKTVKRLILIELLVLITCSQTLGKAIEVDDGKYNIFS